MTAAAEVLARQAELAERVEHSLVGEWLIDLMATDGVISSQDHTRAETSAAISACIRRSRCYRVAENMTAAIAARAQELPEDLTIGSADTLDVETQVRPPRPCGFVILDEPLRFHEINMRETIVHLLTWAALRDQTGKVGYLVTLWNDVCEEPDEIIRANPEWVGHFPARIREFGRYVPVFGLWLPLLGTVGPVWLSPSRRQAERSVRELTRLNPQNVNFRRVLAATWQLLDETIPAEQRHVDISTDYTPRAAVKRAQRGGYDPEVTIVVLRRERRPTIAPGTGQKQTYRQMIDGGFTRTYWIGHGANKVPVKRTIGPYWSNKDDSLPIRQNRTVSELRR